MRIIKDANERKTEILDATDQLFNLNGFDGTSISDIIEKIGIARGTLYYHFKSKEDILDTLTQRRSTELLTAAKNMAKNKDVPVLERLLQTLLAMNGDKDGQSELTHQMHKPQNALMHQKNHEAMLIGIPPILMEIIEDGIAQGLFDTPYPYESLEMIVAHVNTVFDDFGESMTEEELLQKIKAFIFNMERLFGAKPGSFNSLIRLFHMD